MSFKLTKIEALDGCSVDTVGLADLLANTAWHTIYMFNYMYDLPWVVSHFPPNADIDMHVIYGYKASANQEGKDLEAGKRECARNASKVRLHLHGVRLINQYATHHSKIMIFVGASRLQIVIHTANMIEFDWANMTQGVWISPLLERQDAPTPHSRFRGDFTRYLMAYNIPAVTKLAESFTNYNFSGIHDTLVASVPGQHLKPWWGLRRLKQELAELHVEESICQISSIATLPQQFLPKLASCLNCPLSGLAVVYPTMQNIQESLNGWQSGGSIHLKRKTTAHDNQYDRLAPHLRQWKNLRHARDRAAPHIKTYTGITDNQAQYFLLTSTNLSTQAWGSENPKKGTIYIQSWECGVLRKHGEIPLIYNLPLVPYGPQDKAWSVDTFLASVS